MKIVLLESLDISQEILDQYAQKLKAAGVTPLKIILRILILRCRLSAPKMPTS